MRFSKRSTGRVLFVRVEHDAELIQFIKNLAIEQKISVAAFTAIGAFKSAVLDYYDQKTHRYTDHEVNQPCELVSCIGNISLKDGTPFVHAHAVLSDSSGNTNGGHLKTGMVFAAEIHMFELRGDTVERKLDIVTGLSLWDL